MDALFRFTSHSLCPRRPRSACASCSCPQTVSTALFWLDSLQVLPPLPDFMTSPTEPTWFPPGALDICVWTAEERETPGARQVACGARVNVPCPTVCHIPRTVNLPFLLLFVCRAPHLPCLFVALSHPVTFQKSPSVMLRTFICNLWKLASTMQRWRKC